MILPEFQVSRAAVEGYTGEGEPPCIVMTLKPKSDKIKPPDLTLPVTLTGVREPNNIIVIKRRAEGKLIIIRDKIMYKIIIINKIMMSLQLIDIS